MLEDRNGNGSWSTNELAESNWQSSDTDGDTLSDLQEAELANNVLVNSPWEDYGNEQNTQDETTLVAFSNTVVVAYVDSNLGQVGYGTMDNSCSFPMECNMPTNLAPRFIGWAVSTDGGLTFADKGAPPLSTNILDGITNIFGVTAGDPVLVCDTTSNIVYLAGNPKRPSAYFLDGTNQPPKHYAPLWRSFDNGQSFLPPTNAVPALLAASIDHFVDKPAIIVDNFPGSGQGNVYVAIYLESKIYIYRSGPGGTTLQQSTNLGFGAFGVSLAVGSNHNVYATWREITNGTNIAFALSKSVNVGTNFTSPTNFLTLRSTNAVPFWGRFTNSPVQDSFRAGILPNLVANPANGHLYLVYHDTPTNTLDRMDIFFVQSTNAGASWTGPFRVNSDTTTADQWQPVITVKPDGTKVFIAWYDRRADSSNSLIQTYGVFANLPITNANAFATNFPISTVRFPPVFTGANTNAGTYDLAYPPFFADDDPLCCGSFGGRYRDHMGDYDAAVSDNSYIYYPWADNRDFTAGTQVTRHDANVRLVRASWPK